MKFTSFPKCFFWLLAAAIILITSFLYWPQPKMGFVLDDHYVIEQNSVIKNPALYPKILSAKLFAAAHHASESTLNYYRPILMASFALDYKLWGLNAFGYRMVNIGLHALNSVLVFILLFLLFENRRLAAVASIYFCILPVHEWVVRYIVGRGDLLECFFTLVSLTTLLLYFQKTTKPWLMLSLAAFLAALLCREVAILNAVNVFMISYYRTRDFKKTVKIFSLFFN